MAHPEKILLVCQGKACRKVNAKQVLAAFQAQPIANGKIQLVPCFGQCGNGPMVLVLPEEIWYDRVQPEEVGKIVQRHLQAS